MNHFLILQIQIEDYLDREESVLDIKFTKKFRHFYVLTKKEGYQLK